MSVTALTETEDRTLGERFAPGVYVTDGTRLFRVISPGGSLFPSVELEDCLTLAVERYLSRDLQSLRLHRVRVARP